MLRLSGAEHVGSGVGFQERSDDPLGLGAQRNDPLVPQQTRLDQAVVFSLTRPAAIGAEVEVVAVERDDRLAAGSVLRYLGGESVSGGIAESLRLGPKQ